MVHLDFLTPIPLLLLFVHILRHINENFYYFKVTNYDIGTYLTMLKIEKRVDAETLEQLKSAGNLVEVVESYDPVMGHSQAIYISDQGIKTGGADPRGDGAAVGR
jgi:gamma-glutamyltranspeptidase